MSNRILDISIKRLLNAPTGTYSNKIKSQSHEAPNQRLYLLTNKYIWSHGVERNRQHILAAQHVYTDSRSLFTII